MDLSIIIVNYKSPFLVLNCLRSIYDETRRHSFEVIVVDNHSEDSSKEVITSQFTGVRWVQMDFNAGFARANNAGIRAAVGDLILLLNSKSTVTFSRFFIP